MSPWSIITLPGVKKLPDVLWHQNPPTYLFRAVLACAWSVHISLLIQIRLLFHWKKCFFGLWAHIIRFKVKKGLIDRFVFQKHAIFHLKNKQTTTKKKTLIDGLESCRLLVDYCDVFINCLDSHSDGTHSLQRIHWWASVVMLHFSKSVLMKKNSSTSWMIWGRVNFQQIFTFVWTIPLIFV